MNILPNLRRDSNRNLPQGGQATIGTFGLPGSGRRRTAAPDTIQARPIAIPAQQAGHVANITPNLLHLSPGGLSVHLRTDRFQAFVRLSEREQRPVAEVMGEWLADCASLIQQSDFADVYGDALPSTAAQKWVAFYADERERLGIGEDDHAAEEYAARGAGFVNITLAMEGN